jgi:hypothetical protein
VVAVSSTIPAIKTRGSRSWKKTIRAVSSVESAARSRRWYPAHNATPVETKSTAASKASARRKRPPADEDFGFRVSDFGLKINSHAPSGYAPHNSSLILKT